MLKRRRKNIQELEKGGKEGWGKNLLSLLYFNFTTRGFDNINNNCTEHRWIIIAAKVTPTPIINP